MPVTEYDQRILDITKELCLILGIQNYNPTFISWEDLDSRVRVPVEFRYDECLVEKYCLTLSAKMKDLLGSDEWKPIIASALIFTKKLRTRLIQVSVLGFAGLLALGIALSITLPILLSEPFTTTRGGSTYTGTVGSVFAPLVGLALSTAGTVLLSVVYARRLRVVADKRAADVVSATSFLNTLNRIAEVRRESGYRENRIVRGPIPLLPDIMTRISRLQAYSEQHQTA